MWYITLDLSQLYFEILKWGSCPPCFLRQKWIEYARVVSVVVLINKCVYAMKLIFLPIAMHYFRLALCGIVSCSSELISACRQAYASYTLRFYHYNVMFFSPQLVIMIYLCGHLLHLFISCVHLMCS